MKNKMLAFAAVIACLITSSSLFAYVADSTFEAYQPQVLVTPDNLPVLSWPDPGVTARSIHIASPGDTTPAGVPASVTLVGSTPGTF